MQRSQPGFLLVNVILAIALSAIVITTLYQSLYQTSRITRRTGEVVDYGTMLAILYNQLEKDISGTFYPLQLEQQPKAQPVTPEQSQQAKKEAAPKEEKEEKVEKLFFSQNDSKGFTSLFTFITTHRLSVYGELQPSIARVAYKIVPVKEHKDLFTVTRQESTKQDMKLFEDSKKIYAYGIMSSLKKFTVKYSIIPDEKEKEEKQTINFDAWDDEIQKKTKRMIPDFVAIEGIFWDPAKKREQPFTFKIPLFAKYKKVEEKPVQTPQQIMAQLNSQQAKKTQQLLMGQGRA